MILQAPGSYELSVRVEIAKALLFCHPDQTFLGRIESDEDYDVVLRLDEPYRRTVADIAQSEIALPDGRRVRLDSVATVEERLGALQIDRRNQERMIQVTADVFGRSSGEVVRDLRRRLAAEVPLPAGTGIHFGGTAEDQAESFRQMGLMLVLGILLVYMVMAAQFESLLDPFLILFSIPFAFTGVALSLTVLRLTVSIMSYIGMILLVGVALRLGERWFGVAPAR